MLNNKNYPYFVVEVDSFLVEMNSLDSEEAAKLVLLVVLRWMTYAKQRHALSGEQISLASIVVFDIQTLQNNYELLFCTVRISIILSLEARDSAVVVGR